MEFGHFWRKWAYPAITIVVVFETLVIVAVPNQNSSKKENPIRSIRSAEISNEESNENLRYLCMESEEDVHRTVKHLGIKCTCPSIYAPVCGSDHITYHNRCFMQCRANQSQEKYNRYKVKLRVKYFGECRHRHGKHNIHQS